mmetsp:Transcript_87522/g.138213  ORF Transcript_87522/g.138213 Transcript_87522/m.138213 type:complete len:249 (-) Transcript_87522:14-760(-)
MNGDSQRSVASFRSEASQNTKPTWWGPLDGPKERPRQDCIGSSFTRSSSALDLSSQPAVGTMQGVSGLLGEQGTDQGHQRSQLQTDVELRRRIEAVRENIADLDRQIADCTSADPQDIEIATLRDSIRKAIDDRQALQHEARFWAVEERLTTTAVDASVSVSSFSPEDIPDGYSCWRECALALESEIKRKSQTTLDLHHRLHCLEGQFRQQLQSVEDQVTHTESSLKIILQRLTDYSAQQQRLAGETA